MMNKYVERTCTEIPEKPDDTSHSESRLLSAFGDRGAYVLMGAPGAGKTEAFKHEADNDQASYVTARNFNTLEDRPEWHDRVLFIDGLDELRAGPFDGRTQLDRIRTKLDKLGRPRFRLACREADWFGANDRDHLKAVARDEDILVLRLDPLSSDDTRCLLQEKWDIGDPDGFITEAWKRGIGSLLTNPQNLEMLAIAVATGTWPKTRIQTFEHACQKLVHEPNIEHELANPDRASTSDLLAAAGQLCAVQLLAGTTGYTLVGGVDDPEYPRPNCIASGDPKILRDVLRTRLFASTDKGRIPIHRHVAEFLAARYFCGLINNRVPVRRVLALLAGEDGRTVSAMRGVAAWFAAHCKLARDDVMERDPLGAVLYGDVTGFSVDEKSRLLACLELDAGRDPGMFAAMHDLDSRWEDVAAPDMEEAFREILTEKETGQGKQTVALAVLRSLQRGAFIPRLTSMLLDVVRNDQSWPVVREAALEAYVRQSRDQGNSDRELKSLLEDVHRRSVSDPLDNLLGRLLRELYPRVLPPGEVGQYLKEQERPTFGGWYWLFWEQEIAERSTDEQFAEVLDSLLETYDSRGWTRKDGASVSYWLRTMPARLIAQYLERSPTAHDQRLFAWLGFAMRDAAHSAKAKITNWLGDNPESYKAVVRLAADRNTDSSRLREEIYRRLSIAVEPLDFGAWCLAQAAETKPNKEAATEFFLEQVVARQDEESISAEVVEMRLAHDRTLVDRYRELRQRREDNLAAFTSSSALLEEQRQTETRQRQEEWRDLVVAHESELRQNRAAPALLHRLVSAYLGWFVDTQGTEGRSRLRSLLGNDSLVDTIIEAFRASTTRDDLPDDDEIFDLADDQKHHLLMLPFLVGLDELSSLRVGEAPLDEQSIRRALAFRFNAPDFWNQEPEWYRSILNCHPDLVADALVRSVHAALRRGAASALGLYELGHDDRYQPVARVAVLRLLKSFPPRCKIEQLHVLTLLLHAADRHVASDTLLQIVEGKLTLGSMDTAQRVYWMCAGLLAAPELYNDRLRDALTGSGSERRVRHAAEFLSQSRPALVAALEVQTLEFLIVSLGNSYRPYGWPDADDASVESNTPTYSSTSLFVDALINTMSSKPSDDATDALERLSGEPTLKSWHVKLHDATSRQREVRREANFRQPTVEQVLETLDNRRPANAADLAALTKQLLCDLGRDIRHGNTADWRQYWNRHPESPQPIRENDCRDRLLSDLKARLGPLNVDALPEPTYADDKRADIRVWCNGSNVPIEIKKSTHNDLWRAIRNQLIAKYTRDPGADGYGIYLVFWFGPDRCKRPPTGRPPETPDTLRDQLLAAANLSPEERRKISVCVIDVSKPESQSGSIAT